MFWRIAGRWARRDAPPRSDLQTASRIGIPDTPDSFFDAARVAYFDVPIIKRFVRPIYLDRFYAIVDRDYGQFRALPYPASEKRAINARILSAVRTVAAFSAWEEVSWAIIEFGFTLAIVVATIAACVYAWLLLGASSVANLAIAFGVILLAIMCARWISFLIPRTWPRSAFTMLLLAAAAGTAGRALQLLAAYEWHAPLRWSALLTVRAATGTSWAPFVEIGLYTAALLWCGFAFVLSASALFYIRVTARRINDYPEEEIIQTVLAILERLCDSSLDGRAAKERVKLVERLEWIARRFESEFVGRYLGHDPATDPLLSQVACGCASRFRSQKRAVVFPSVQSFEELQSFLWSALQNAAQQAWSQIESDDLVKSTPSRRERITMFGRNALALLGPAAFALCFYVAAPVDAGVRANVLITGITWSAITALAMLNPKQFETQAASAKTLGEIFKKSSSS
jgi:hypothetical protein